MSHYGYEIVQTLIVDIEPDEHVKRAMNEINAGMICIVSLSLSLCGVFVYIVAFSLIIWSRLPVLGWSFTP